MSRYLTASDAVFLVTASPDRADALARSLRAGGRERGREGGRSRGRPRDLLGPHRRRRRASVGRDGGRGGRRRDRSARRRQRHLGPAQPVPLRVRAHYQPVRIEGRVLGVEDTHEYAKAGFMVRGSLDPDAAYGAVGLTPELEYELLWRTEPGRFGERLSDDGEAQAAYEGYRLDCIDDLVRLSLSADRDVWHAIDQRAVAIDDEVYVGLVVCSHMPGERATARFVDVMLSALSELTPGG